MRRSAWGCRNPSIIIIITIIINNDNNNNNNDNDNNNNNNNNSNNNNNEYLISAKLKTRCLKYCQEILKKSIKIYPTLKAKGKIQEKLMIFCRN